MISRRRRQELLSHSYPELAAEWDMIANMPLTFDEMSPGSNDKAIWRCRKTSSHIWEARINHRIQGVGCPYCSGRYATPETSLRGLYPDLAAEMHPTRNGTLTADQVKPKGDKVIVATSCPLLQGRSRLLPLFPGRYANNCAPKEYRRTTN